MGLLFNIKLLIRIQWILYRSLISIKKINVYVKENSHSQNCMNKKIKFLKYKNLNYIF